MHVDTTDTHWYIISCLLYRNCSQEQVERPILSYHLAGRLFFAYRPKFISQFHITLINNCMCKSWFCEFFKDDMLQSLFSSIVQIISHWYEIDACYCLQCSRVHIKFVFFFVHLFELLYRKVCSVSQFTKVQKKQVPPQQQQQQCKKSDRPIWFRQFSIRQTHIQLLIHCV